MLHRDLRSFLPPGLGLLALVAGLIAACVVVEETTPDGDKTTSTGQGGMVGSGGQGGSGGTVPETCWFDEIELKSFNTEGPFGINRHAFADDFTLPLRGGESWTLSENFSSCDNYVFLTNARNNSDLDSTSVWARDIDQLFWRSPPNVHYFFVPARNNADAAAEIEALATVIADAMAKADEATAAYWAPRMHVAAGHSSSIGGWLTTILAGQGRAGFGIDRRQQVRLLGSFADVTRYNSQLKAADKWPWENNMSYAAHEARQYNYEAKRDARLAAEEGVTIVTAWEGEVLKPWVEKEIEFPDAAAMATFDTLEIDLWMDCADPNGPEFGSCGAWDYLSHIYLKDETEPDKKTELARFITTYHREGRYIVDVTPMMVHLLKGGKRTLRFDISPEWNQQAYLTKMDFRFSNRSKGYAPRQATFLYGGGSFNDTYNDQFSPIDVPISAAAKRVELWVVISGHGMKTGNCAEFCRHQHEFTIGTAKYMEDHETVGNQEGCIDEIENGMVPNQGGTWWFGRGGWCPGQQVEPWIVDVTNDVTPGETATISYKAYLNGNPPPADSGNIVMTSYLVVHE